MKCSKCGKEVDGNFCPHCGTSIEESNVAVPQSDVVAVKKKKLKWWQIALIVVGIIIVIGAIGSALGGEEGSDKVGGNNTNLSVTQTNESDNNADDKKEDNLKAEITVSAIDIAKEYKDNEVAAEAKYKGKKVEISGIINSIGKDVLDDVYIVLSNGDEYAIINNVQCYFKDKEQISKVADLQKGQEVTLIGTVNSSIAGTVMIKDCYIK